jgi:threonine aldolase
MPMEDGSIDLRSDTVTHPTPEMRKAMYEAEVGDDYYRDDPTVNTLQDKATEMLGTEAALFVCSGTMGNMVSLFTQTQPGQEIIVESMAHVYRAEAGHLAAVSGLMCRRVEGMLGIMDPSDIEENIRAGEIYEPKTVLIALETPSNGAGGTILPRENIAAIAEIAHRYDLALHIDGARIFNATVALRANPADYIEGATSIMFCLSKSLCCPFGSLILGSNSFIEEARHWRLMLGGTLRQAGIMAAAGIVALDCMIERLAEDHINARHLAEQLVEAGLAKLDLDTVQTNMVRTDFSHICSNGADLHDFLLREGIKISINNSGFSRLVTHYWITSEDIEKVLVSIREYARENPTASATQSHT